MRIALFVTCLGDTLYPEAGRATVEVLERLGHEVVFPAEQTCCGQMHVNSGYREEALRWRGGSCACSSAYEAVVAPSSSCAARVRDLYPELLGERPAGCSTASTSCRSCSWSGSASRTSARRIRTASRTTRRATRSA